MNGPDVITIWKDPEKQFTLRIYAYRKVTPLEARQALALWLKNCKLKKIPRNVEASVITIFGHDE